jgi:RhoGAP domain
VLTGDGVLLWFTTAQPFRFITTARANGFMQIGAVDGVQAESKVVFDNDEPTLIVLENKRHGTYRLHSKTVEETQEWLLALRNSASGKTSSVAAEARCFGAPLESLTLSSSGVPVVIENITTFLRAHGTGVQGIFRISAGADAAAVARQTLEADDTAVPWTDGADERCHVAAATLKALLRDMPQPLIPQDLYPKLIGINGKNSVTVAQVLAADLALRPVLITHTLRHVFSFAHFLMGYSEKTSMDAGNLAIVFGPNILRPEMDLSSGRAVSAMTGLADTPRVLSVIRAMIENADEIFGLVEAARDDQSGGKSSRPGSGVVQAVEALPADQTTPVDMSQPPAKPAPPKPQGAAPRPKSKAAAKP